MADTGNGTSALPVDRLKDAAQTLLKAATDKAVGAAIDKVDGLTDRLSDVAESGGKGIGSVFGGGGGDSDDDGGGGGGIGGALKAGFSKVKDTVGNVIPGMSGSDDDEDSDDDSSGGGGGGDSSGRGKFKFLNIFEVQDVGVPLRVAYDQWTQFADFPSFMKKLESVNQESDEKSTWTAKVFWSRRSWETTIREQIPDTHIIWVSSGAKGYADGCVTFSEVAPNLTRICLIMEYYPQGFFEKTGNIWRAVGRRARLEFKHFCRHVMMDTLINREELEGWRGEIRDSEVVKTHEEAMEEEQAALESDEDAEDEAELDDAELEEDDLEDDLDPEDEPDGAEAVDEDEEPLDDEFEDDYEDEPADEVDEVEDEDAPVEDEAPVEEEPQERPRRKGRRRTPAGV